MREGWREGGNPSEAGYRLVNDNTNIVQNTYPTMHRALTQFGKRRKDGD